ncbi:MAG: PilX N-terminal domain-containing pilus assembly protein [Massilia sp.]
MAPLSAATQLMRQHGVTLFMALFFLLMVTMVALATARIALDGERGARAERDRQLAFQAAEAGLLDAERDITGGANPGSPRAGMFHDDGAIGFATGCGHDPVNLGLCAYSPGAPPAWQTVDASATAAYGSFTGAVFPYGGPLPLAPPRYVIERLPLVQAGIDASSARSGKQGLFRITAFGYGARAGTLVVLQSVYRSSDGLAGLP